MPHQPVFDIPNFDRVTTDKLAYYLIMAQESMYETQRRHTRTSLTPLYEDAEREWKADLNNPTTIPPNPLTVEVVKKFYQKCDAICSLKSPKNTTPQLLRIIFASSNGAQFILSMLFQHKHPSHGKILRTATAKLNEALGDPKEILAARGGTRDSTPAPIVSPGDVLRYMDANNRECRIRIKDHGSSAMRGEFFIVTTIIDEDADSEDKFDREVTVEEMEQMVRHRI